ncbi:hypothetical protein EB73_34735 [Mycobacterium sp. SWH-M3]|nr:hypothetical protein EB73_34735 [Mycobacterium sp. SWH-M3]
MTIAPRLRPLSWDTTHPPHLAVAGLILRWIHSGSRWRVRIVYGLLIWQMAGIFLLVIAGPAFADPTGAQPSGGDKPNPADTSMFGWIDVKDSSDIPVSQYFIAVDQGNAFSVIPGVNNDKKANIALAPILELEYGLVKITCQIALWIIGYGLSFKWMNFIATPFQKLGDATESLTNNTAILVLALTLAGGVAAFAVVRGRHSKAAYQVGSALVITALMGSVFAQPVAQLLGEDGYLSKARDVGISISSGITEGTGNSPAGSAANINKLQTSLADGFLRTPTQLLNFNANVDKNGCKDVWNSGIRKGDRDKLKDAIEKCGGSGKKMKYAADHLTGDRLASAAAIEILAGILLVFGCYLIGKIVLATIIALTNAILLPVVGTLGVVAGGLQGMAFKCLCNIGLALIKLPLTVVYAGAYASLLGSMLKVDGNPVQILLLATILLVIAVVAFRRIDSGLKNSHGNVLSFLNRGGGSPERPKATTPTLLKRTGALALQAGAATFGVPPSLTGLAIGAGRGVRNKVSPPKAHKLPATQSPEDQAQQQWWAQQHQWYGAQYQWWATNQHDSADAAAPVTTSASGPSSPLPAPPADAPPSAPRVHDVLREAPPMHPYVASAVGAMPQQIQQASSLPPVDMSFCGAPLARGGRCSNRAGSCPHHSAGGGSLPPLPPTPTRAPRSTPVYSAPSPADSARTMSLPSAPAPQPAPAAAVPAPPRSRVADLINTPR